jgi:hypothetical protein
MPDLTPEQRGSKMKFTFVRDVTLNDWPALPRAFKTGETVFKLEASDYGCAADDLRMGGIKTIACTFDPGGEYPFFTIPVDYLA